MQQYVYVKLRDMQVYLKGFVNNSPIFTSLPDTAMKFPKPKEIVMEKIAIENPQFYYYLAYLKEHKYKVDLEDAVES